MSVGSIGSSSLAQSLLVATQQKSSPPAAKPGESAPPPPVPVANSGKDSDGDNDGSGKGGTINVLA